MLPCANLLVLPFVLTSCQVLAAIENDTVVVGSYVHETKVKAPTDLLGASSKKHKKHDDTFNGDSAEDGFKNTYKSKGKDGYDKFDTFNSKDGDRFGYSQKYEFGKDDDGKKGAGFDDFHSFDDEDEAAGSISPKYSEWHFGKDNIKPMKSYRFESEDGDNSKGKLVGPDYEGFSGSSKGRRLKRKKDNVQPAATEYDNYEYADTEEPDEAPADFEAEEAPDPEYGPLYAEADAYDYY